MSVGFQWPLYFTKNPVKDGRRKIHAQIKDVDGKVFFEQDGVEIPDTWTNRAGTIVASQYFRNVNGQQEYSVFQVVGRITGTIREWGEAEGYFKSETDAQHFEQELTHILLTQKAAFNSPVWYNFGVPGANQQGSACFIGDVEDEMESITDRVKIEARIFKWGSGFGCNNSRLRASTEGLSYGGTSSGPVSFMLLYDAAAEVVRSAGMRRAAKMEVLDVDHPDVMKFIRCKGEQEALGKIAKEILGTDGINQTAVRHQNANHSVSVTDQFMRAAEMDDLWSLIARNSMDGETDPRMIDGELGTVLERVSAKSILQEIAEQAWACGDPGLQYHDNINRMNTVPSWGRIISSNPCSEFFQPPWSACNLASINLKHFFVRASDGQIEFLFADFVQTVRTLILAMDIVALCADYPDERIEENSRRYRPLGLGYTNLGATLVRLGFPYDSPEGRSVAARITALMSGAAWDMSAGINEYLARVEKFPRKDLIEVIEKHKDSAKKLNDDGFVRGLTAQDVYNMWVKASAEISRFGTSNSQVTLLAPTGTISFLMDAETTGVEPLVMLGGVKKLADGGQLRFDLPECVNSYLRSLTPSAVHTPDSFIKREDDETFSWVLPTGMINRIVKERVLDTAMGGMEMNTISYHGHVKMMAAVQPFLSGAISKTVNLPNEVTVDEIRELYVDAWKMGLKSIAVYRDGSKFEQVYNVDKKKEDKAVESPQVNGLRVKLPDERDSKTHKFHIGQHKGYITTGLYPDGKPGEIFIVMNKQGSTVRGLLDTIATLVSMCLQYGVPLSDLVSKFKGVKFEPQGITKNQDILFAQSPVDYIFRYLDNKFVPGEDLDIPEEEIIEVSDNEDGNPCSQCGTIMTRRGTCEYCDNCDITTGCS